MTVRIKSNVLKAREEETFLAQPPSNTASGSIWMANRAYFGLVEKLRALKLARPGTLSIAFTSTLPGEGVTHVVDGLSHELARQSQERVAAIAASEFRESAGMSALLDDGDDSDDEGLVPQLWKADVPDGWRNADGTVLQKQFGSLGKRFDYVLVDCPSLKSSSDVLVVAKHCAGVCLVVEAGRTTRTQIQGALATFSLASIPVLCFVLNKRTYPVPEFLYKHL